MIKFFSKIRQRLVTESKFSKYLLYALGEIVLVVIGILIALQINNWSKHQAVKENNEVYYAKLLEELKLNISRLNSLAFDNENKLDVPCWAEAVGNCDSLLTFLGRGLQEKDLDFLLKKDIWSGGSQLNLHDATYEELLGTGKLYSLGSDSLILGLKNYYKRYEREIEYNSRWTDYAIEGLNQTEYSRVIMQLDYTRNLEHFNLLDYPWFFDSKSKEYIDLQLGTRKMYRGQKHHLRKCKELIESSEQLIDLIEREVQKQDD